MTKKRLILNLTKFFIVLSSTFFISACGGNNSEEKPEKDSNSSIQSPYISPTVFASYFNNTKDETQTTSEFIQKQEEKLTKISTSKLITEINRSGYDADTGYASFTLEFSYKKNDLFQGPSYSIDTNFSKYNSGALTSQTNSYKDIVFTNEPEEFYLYSASDALISCTNIKLTEYDIYKTTTCTVKVYVNRLNLYDYDFHAVFDINVNTLKSNESSSTVMVSSHYMSTYRYKDLPIYNLNAISIIDRKTDKVFGSFHPYQ